MPHTTAHRRGARRSRTGLAVTGLAVAVAMVGLTSTPASAAGPMKQVRFDCTAPNNGSFAWYVPNGLTSLQLEVAGGAGGGDAQPGFTGRGGKGAVVTATVSVWTGNLTVRGTVGCSGSRTTQGQVSGGAGGSGLTANNGAAGGSSTQMAVLPEGSGDVVFVRAGAGGGGGGRGSGFGVNAGGDGGDAGANGVPSGSPATPGDNGRPGGGASGTTNAQGAPSATCPALDLGLGHPGLSAQTTGAGGGGGGGGDTGGCGGGAGFRVVSSGKTTIGSGGGGQAGSTMFFGDHLSAVTLVGKNRGDGYVLITYQGS